MKKYCFLYILLFSLPCLAEPALNLSQDTTIKEPYANNSAMNAVINHTNEEQSSACACENPYVEYSDAALNLSQYKTIKELYASDPATLAMIKRMGDEIKYFYPFYDIRPFRYTMLISKDKGTIYRMNNGLYFGKICNQGDCDMVIQKKGHKTIFIIDKLVRSFNIFYKDSLSEEEANKILSEAQKVILHNVKKSKSFTLELNFFNQ